MFTKINALLNPNTQGGRQPGVNPDGRRGRQGQAEIPDAAAEDSVLLSLGAVRALVQEETSLASASHELLRQIALLEQHGLQNLPVRGGQPVADAIREAVSFFASSR